MPQPSHVNIDTKLPNVAGPSSSGHTGNSSAPSPTSPARETPNFSRPLFPSPTIGRSQAPSPAGAVTGGQATRSTSNSPRPLPSVPGHPHSHPQHSNEHAQGGRGSGLGTRIIDDRDPDDFVPPQRHGHGQDEDERASTAASDSELLYASAPSTPPHAHAELDAEKGEGGDSTVRIGGNGEGWRELPERRATVALGEDVDHGRKGSGEGSASPRRAATMDYDLRGNQGRPLPVPQASQTHEQATASQGSGPPPDDLEDVESYLRKFVEQSGDEPTFPEPRFQGRTASPPSFPEPQPHQPRSLPQPLLFGLPVPETHASTNSETGHRTDSRPPLPIPAPIPVPNPSTQRQDNSWRTLPSSTHGTQSSGQVGSAAGHFIAGTNLEFEPLPYPHDTHTHVQSYAGSSVHTHPPRPLPPSPVARQDSAEGATLTPSIAHDSKRKSDQEAGSSLPGHAPAAGSGGAGPIGTAPLRVSKHAPSSSAPSGAPIPSSGREGQSSRPPLPLVPVSGGEKPPTDPVAKVALSSEAGAPKPQVRPQPKIPVAPESTSEPQPGTPTPSSAGPVPSPPRALRPTLKRNVGASSPASPVQEPQTSKPVGRDTVRPPPTPPKPVGTPEKEATGTSAGPANRAKEPHPSAPRPQSQSDPVSTTSHPGRPPPAESQQPRTVAEEKAKYNAIPPSSRSRYMNMLLALDDIPTISNLSASFFTWILLAGFVLFPGTFTSLRSLNLSAGVGAALVDRIVNLPLFVIAFVCTGVGIIGMVYLWWRWMNNYIWLVNKIFLPGLLNSLAGIISTLVNIYGVHNGEFSRTSIVTISVTGGVAVMCGLLVLWYGVWMLGRVKKHHRREIGVEKAGSHGEGVWGGFKEKVSNVGKRK